MRRVRALETFSRYRNKFRPIRHCNFARHSLITANGYPSVYRNLYHSCFVQQLNSFFRLCDPRDRIGPGRWRWGGLARVARVSQSGRCRRRYACGPAPAAADARVSDTVLTLPHHRRRHTRGRVGGSGSLALRVRRRRLEIIEMGSAKTFFIYTPD